MRMRCLVLRMMHLTYVLISRVTKEKEIFMRHERFSKLCRLQLNFFKTFLVAHFVQFSKRFRKRTSRNTYFR